MARGTKSTTLSDSNWGALPSNTVASGGNVVVENQSFGTLEVTLDTGEANVHEVERYERIYFKGLTNTNQAYVKGSNGVVVCYSWGA